MVSRFSKVLATARESNRLWLVLCIIVLGVVPRLVVEVRGHNYDLDSYMIVADIVQRGGNVYAETERYNYGPIWFSLIGGFDSLARMLGFEGSAAFRVVLVSFLTLVDLGIAYVLWVKRGGLVAAAFFLNPVSILITGYHNQFENLALLIGFWSVMVLDDRFDEPINRRKLAGLGLLGLSLMTKHVLFAFPLWLAVKQKGVLQKLIVLLVPIGLFALGFLPFWADGQTGIVQNVFLYESRSNQIFYRIFVPSFLREFVSATVIWLGVLLVFAFVFRKRAGFESILFYTAILTATAPAMANQYLVIPLAFMASFPNLLFILYTLCGTFYLMIDGDGLGLGRIQEALGVGKSPFYAVLICLILLQVFWVTCGDWIRRGAGSILRRFRANGIALP